MTHADNVIHVELYGVLSERAGQARLELSLTQTTALADVLAQIVARLPELAAHMSTTACAIDDELVHHSATINPGATLALLPPVSGG